MAILLAVACAFGARAVAVLRRARAERDALARRLEEVERTGVSERQRLQEAERDARGAADAASRVKDDLLATASHELRTPLNAVLGWARLLRGGKLDAADSARAIENIERSASAQAQIVDDLLDIARIGRGELRLDVRRVELVPVIEAAVSAVRPAAVARNIGIASVLAPHAGPVSGDPGRLQQAVWNLLSNAVKFTPPGGRVEIRLEDEGDEVAIRVKDTGPGIAPELLPHLFEPFRQADSSNTRTHGGLGLGLAIVRHLVEAHGGTVCATSDGHGKGAAFTIRLPASARGTGAGAQRAARPGASEPGDPRRA